MSNPQINSSKDGQCGYLAFYNGKQAEVWADSQYAAKQLAIVYFKVRKSQQHMVSVVLCEKDGEQVTHTAVD